MAHAAPPDTPPPTQSTGPTPDASTLLTPTEWADLTRHEVGLAETLMDFISWWEQYGAYRTDAPCVFHRSVALVLVAAALDRQCYLQLQHKTIYPSLYILNLADSGQRKSTPQNYGTAAALHALKDRLLGNDYSPEALIEDLASRDVSRGVAFIDEAGRLLSTMRRDRYGEGLKDLLSHLWDCPEEYHRKLRAHTYDLKSIYINLLMASTRTRFYETVIPEDITSGFLARFLPVIATEDIQRRPLSQQTLATGAHAATLTEMLTLIRKRRAGPLPITDDALARLDDAEAALETWVRRVYHADLIRPWARRLAEYGQRLAILFTVSENRPVIERPQVLRALAMIDHAKEDMAMLVDDLMKDHQARSLDKLYRFIAANPGITRRGLQRCTSMRASQIDELTTALREQERIQVTLKGTQQSYYPRSDPQAHQGGSQP